MRLLRHDEIPRVGLLTPREVASIFYVHPHTVAKWARTGRISSITTPGGHRRYPAEEMWLIAEGS